MHPVIRNPKNCYILTKTNLRNKLRVSLIFLIFKQLPFKQKTLNCALINHKFKHDG